MVAMQKLQTGSAGSGDLGGGASFTAALQVQGPCLALPSDTQEPQSIMIAFLSQALYDMAWHWQAIVP